MAPMSERLDAFEKLPEDDWHTHVFVFLDATCCTECGLDSNLRWAWENLPSDRDAADVFTNRAVKFLRDAGWQMHDGFPWCPECAAKRFPNS